MRTSAISAFARFLSRLFGVALLGAAGALRFVYIAWELVSPWITPLWLLGTMAWITTSGFPLWVGVTLFVLVPVPTTAVYHLWLRERFGDALRHASERLSRAARMMMLPPTSP